MERSKEAEEGGGNQIVDGKTATKPNVINLKAKETQMKGVSDEQQTSPVGMVNALAMDSYSCFT
jgi:hypothetical protein